MACEPPSVRGHGMDSYRGKRHPLFPGNQSSRISWMTFPGQRAITATAMAVKKAILERQCSRIKSLRV